MSIMHANVDKYLVGLPVMQIKLNNKGPRNGRDGQMLTYPGN